MAIIDDTSNHMIMTKMPTMLGMNAVNRVIIRSARKAPGVIFPSNHGFASGRSKNGLTTLTDQNHRPMISRQCRWFLRRSSTIIVAADIAAPSNMTRVRLSTIISLKPGRGGGSCDTGTNACSLNHHAVKYSGVISSAKVRASTNLRNVSPVSMLLSFVW
jgi:hypothetical protein